jgi:cytochrome c-type biogenesis protein
MGDLPLGLAVTAGTLAALNPCGFALLPVYLSALILGDDAPSRGRAVARALVTAASITAGFAGVFAVFGLVLISVADTMQRQLPWFTIALGLALLPLGAWLLAGRAIPSVRWSRPGPALRRSAGPMAAFGAAYALASLGCTVGPFLAIVVSAFGAGSTRTGSTPGGILLLLAYAAGMGLVVGTAALAVAVAHTELLARMRRLAPVVSRAGGAVMVVAGAYVAYYGWYEIRLRRGDDPADPVIEAAGAVQGWLERCLDQLGPAVVLLVFAVALAGSALLVWHARRARSHDRAGPATVQDLHDHGASDIK